MSIKAVLFDLDGTLLPMDQDIFIKAYFGGLVSALAPHGYEPKALADTIWQGTAAMVKNDGTKRNEERFWEKFTAAFGERRKESEPLLEAFYNSENGFLRVREVLGYTEKARKTIDLVHSLGLRAALATNPVFPAIATEKRMSWAGLSPEDFELCTTYENSRFCKPNLAYYKDIIEKLGVSAEECVMVGNDVGDDMVAEQLGMKVFLLTDCLINKTDRKISDFPNGDFKALMSFLKNL